MGFCEIGRGAEIFVLKLVERHLLQHERAHREDSYRVIVNGSKSPDGKSLKEVNKGVWGMPRLSEAKKDVISCDKLRGSANRNYIRRFPNGATQCTEGALFIVR